jgi:cytochrome c biogenesis protein
MTQAVLALSDAASTRRRCFELKDFKQVQASVFQVARAPGKNLVYLGCGAADLGVFAMLYIRERRLWVWLAPRRRWQPRHCMALSSNRARWTPTPSSTT